MKKKIIITGSSGFIGFHVSKKFLEKGWNVIGIDSITDYYNKQLKFDRENILLKDKNFINIRSKIQKKNLLLNIFKKYNPEIVIHLAAQAGVRYSINFPDKYISSNIIGSFELLEACKKYPPRHILMASSSSVYGANENYPYFENDKTDFQLSFYAATKKSVENLSHSYSYLYKLPITSLRFFTVYGPWSRPDMAVLKFTDLILKKKSLQIYNNGNALRDFTYIDDLVNSIYRLIKKIPKHTKISKHDSLSPIAPYRTINIGNQKPESINHLVNILEKEIGIKAKKINKKLQMGDVSQTHASTKLLYDLIKFVPNTPLEIGISKFFKWYKNYNKI